MIERVSLGASIAGLLTSGLTQNFIFAALPLTLNASLGFWNRQRLEKQLQNVSARALTSIQAPEYLQDIAGINQKIFNFEKCNNQNSEQVFSQLQFLESNFSGLHQKLQTAENMMQVLQLEAQDSNNMLPVQPAENEFSKRLTELESGVAIMQRRVVDFSEVEKLKALQMNGGLENWIQQSIAQAIEENFVILKKALPQDYQYDLIRGRKRSREILIKALNEVENQLIMICPWLKTSAIDDYVQKMIQSNLEKGVNIEIGWGFSGDLFGSRKKISQQNLLTTKPTMYDAFESLSQLAEKFPNLKLKVMGTHEKILVCDRKFAMIGSHNFLASGSSSKEREMGILTTNPQIISQIIAEFEGILNPDSHQQLKMPFLEAPISLSEKINNN